MKHWPSQLFPVILLAVLAGLSFWLQKAVEPEPVRTSGKLRHDPDSFAENFTVRRYDTNGMLRYHLSAPYMVHYADDDSSELRSPKLISYRPEAPIVTTTGDHAQVSSKGETIFLWDNVVIVRDATPERAQMIARMPDLTTQPEAGFAFTNSPVEITQGQSWIKGVGAQLDNNLATFVLQSRVTGLYIRPRATQ